MDNFKKSMKNMIYSNKSNFSKNSNSNSNSNITTSNSNIFKTKQFNSSKNINNTLKKNIPDNEFITVILWVLLFVIVIIICYLTVMTAKYLSTKCIKKRSWFSYVFRFSYMDICIAPKVPLPGPVPPVVNNIHLMKPGTAPPQMPAIPPNIPTIKSSQPELKKEESSLPLFGKKEVFHIANQDYTYEQAKCKCKSYNSELATYSQLVDAFNSGAEWCTYGWSSGQKAYYPTQKCNWEKKSPEEKLKCGNPGLNGGFFADPYLKFGVNCYGKKPKGKVSQLNFPVCPSQSYCALPQNFGASNRLESDEISPFNSQKWNN